MFRAFFMLKNPTKGWVNFVLVNSGEKEERS